MRTRSSSDRLLDELWGGVAPASGSAALRVRISQLRKSLGTGADRLETTPPGYRLRLAPGELDLDRFTTLVGEAAGAEPEIAADRLREALALLRGRRSPTLPTSRSRSLRSAEWRSCV
jgi:DNA-binding SARP family transcriptional activator